MRHNSRCPRRSLRPTLAVICTLTALAGCAMLASSSPACGQDDLSDTYQWKPVKIGGGGFTMGIVIHPETGDRYIRNDVNAAYRWDGKKREWRLLIRADNMPPNDPMLEAVQYNGAQSIAVAPSDPNRVYLAWGTEYYSPTIGALYASDDKGETWVRRSEKTDFVMKANAGIGRMEGERLAVDPANADVAYFGATSEGLWRTTDGGKSWQQIPTGQVPVGIPAQQLNRNQKTFPVGVAMVVFDPTGAVIDGRSQRIWCTVWGEGIYRSDDGGETWSKVHERPDVTELVVAKDGTAYATAGRHNDGTTAHCDPDHIALRFRDKVWTDISPKGCSRESNVAVSPTDPDFLFVFDGNGTPYRSHDGGDTWTAMKMERVAEDIPWLAWTDAAYFATAEVIFEPVESGRLWCCNGIGVWSATGLDGDTLVWNSVTAGIEDLVAQHVIKSPGGPIVGSVMDRSIFVINDPDRYALRHHPDRKFRGGRMADFCVSQPECWAAVSTGQVMLSSNHGESWDWTPARPGGDEVRVRTVAVAADDPEVMAAVTENRQLYWTDDGGRNWQAAPLPGGPGDSATLEADRVAPKTFYWYDNRLGFLASTDGGKSWSVRAVPADLPTPSVRQLSADYQRAGHLLVCWGLPGGNGGVARSIDGGRTWERIRGLQQGWVCSFGKSKIEGGPSTMYVRGICAGRVGIWRSTDDGKTWQSIGDHPLGIYHQGEHMWADWEQFGVVYLALRGNGFAYGQPVE